MSPIGKGYVAAARLDELPPGQPKMLRLNEYMVALYNVDGTIYATTNNCPHSGGPLAKGELDGEMITCPWHMWSFNVRTGECDMNPEEKIEIYPVKIKDGQIFVKLP